MEEKICYNINCQKPFQPKIYWQIFCSVKCRVQHHNDKAMMKKIQCPHCFKEINLKEAKDISV